MSDGIRILMGVIIGGAVGYAIYRFIGCRTGACPLNSNPYISMVIWALCGALIATGK